MIPNSPLNDPGMYLKLAQAAASRGNPQPGSPGQPQPPGPPGMPQLIQAFAQGLQQIIPNLQPPQLQAIIQLLIKIMGAEDAQEAPGM